MQVEQTVKKYDTYKDSGIEWIGEIPQEWNARKLFGLLATIGSGTTPKGNDNYYDGEIYWLNTGDLNDSYINEINKTVTDLAMTECSALKLFDKDSVVIAMYGATIGKLGILTFPTTTNQACCVMSCGNKLNNKYLFYTLYSARDYILTLSYGAGQPNISQETMKSFKLCCPDIVEQQQIAEYLDKKCGAIDEVIETEKSVIEKLKEYKQSIITEAVTKGLDKSVPLKDSGIEWIGKIPQHWNVAKLKRLTQILTCGYASTPQYYDEGIPFLSAQNVKNGKLCLDKFNRISEELHQELTKYKKPQKGDILQVRVGATIGQTCIVDSNLDFSIYVSLTHIRTNERMNNRYLSIILGSNSFINEAINRTFQGGGVGNLNVQDLRNIYCPIPSKEEQQLIAEYLDKKCSEIDKAIADKEQVIEKFTEYKKSLIYECVTGKRKVV